METTHEQRRHRRVNVMDAVVVMPNGHGHPTRVIDISFGGARIATIPDWKPLAGAPLKVMFLPETEAPIVVQARVARIASDHLGIEFGAVQEKEVEQLLQLLGSPE